MDLKWINHQVITGMAVYTVTGNLLFAAYSMAGAVLPDKMEGNPRTAKSYWSWRSRHRGWSHWPAPYLAVIAFLLIVDRRSLAAMDMWDLSLIAMYAMMGALLHIAEDAVCGKVPLFRLSQKLGIRLFTVGSFTEYLFSIAAVLLLYLLKTIGCFP